ncbi:MAG: VacJ family lipoprotein [Caedimonadaceae bacterium]|nr:MAG: VacJ family lipoprotein [Caedimonadaceae bacterium]
MKRPILFGSKLLSVMLSVSSFILIEGCEHTSDSTSQKNEPQHLMKPSSHETAKSAVSQNDEQTSHVADTATKGQTSSEDPLEDFNRSMFTFNELIDGLFLKPAAQIYELCVHEKVRDGVHNMLQNLGSPVVLINDILQGSPQKASETATRFVINTTFGLVGYFDPAAEILNIEYHFEDFSQTLAVWGVDSGPYLMVPFLGPSNPRDLTGRVVDWFADPFTYWFRNEGRRGLTYVRLGADYIDKRSRSFEIEKTIYSSNDPYTMMKTLYVQNRQFHINDGLVDQDSPTPDEE